MKRFIFCIVLSFMVFLIMGVLQAETYALSGGDYLIKIHHYSVNIKDSVKIIEDYGVSDSSNLLSDDYTFQENVFTRDEEIYAIKWKKSFKKKSKKKKSTLRTSNQDCPCPSHLIFGERKRQKKLCRNLKGYSKKKSFLQKSKI